MSLKDKYTITLKGLLSYIENIIDDKNFIEQVLEMKENNNWSGLKKYWELNVRDKLMLIMEVLIDDIYDLGNNTNFKLYIDYQKDKILEIITDIISIFVPEYYVKEVVMDEYDFDHFYKNLKIMNADKKYTSYDMLVLINNYNNSFLDIEKNNYDDILERMIIHFL